MISSGVPLPSWHELLSRLRQRTSCQGVHTPYSAQKQRLLKKSIQIEAKIPEKTRTCDVGTSSGPGCTALGGVTSHLRKCSRLQQEVRGFSIFALFSDWAGGFDEGMSALSGDVHCFWFCSVAQKQRLLKKSIQIEAKIPEKTRTCDVGTSSGPGCTALGGVTSHLRKCSRLQQEVRGFSIFALFSDWAGGFDEGMSALSGDVHCFWFCSVAQKQRLLKKSIKIDAKIPENKRIWRHNVHRVPRRFSIILSIRRLVVCLSLGGMLTPMKNCACHQ